MATSTAGAHSDRVTESHKYTAWRRCASIMSRPAATAGRENNDEPVGPTPALIYLPFLARMQQICFCRVSSTLSTLEECNHIREESFVCHFNAFRRGRETNERLQLDVPRLHRRKPPNANLYDKLFLEHKRKESTVDMAIAT